MRCCLPSKSDAPAAMKTKSLRHQNFTERLLASVGTIAPIGSSWSLRDRETELK
jgi:hypothetical protein